MRKDDMGRYPVIRVPKQGKIKPSDLAPVQYMEIPWEEIPFLWQGVEISHGDRYEMNGNIFQVRYYMAEKCWILVKESKTLSRNGFINWRDMNWMSKMIPYLQLLKPDLDTIYHRNSTHNG